MTKWIGVVVCVIVIIGAIGYGIAGYAGESWWPAMIFVAFGVSLLFVIVKLNEPPKMGE